MCIYPVNRKDEVTSLSYTVIRELSSVFQFENKLVVCVAFSHLLSSMFRHLLPFSGVA